MSGASSKTKNAMATAAEEFRTASSKKDELQALELKGPFVRGTQTIGEVDIFSVHMRDSVDVARQFGRGQPAWTQGPSNSPLWFNDYNQPDEKANEKAKQDAKIPWLSREAAAQYANTGLTDAQAAVQLKAWGLNKLQPPYVKPGWLLFLEHQSGFFSLLLWGAAFLCFIAYGLDSSDPANLYLGIVLSVVVFFTGVFSYYQDARSAAVMSGFKNFFPAKSLVIRNGAAPYEIASENLVPGDIVVIENGKNIPADIRITKSDGLKVDNSSLTGEPDSLPRSDILTKVTDKGMEPACLEAVNMCFFGTLCAEGSGQGIVVGTGDNTVIGRIAKLTTGTDNAETPISKEIHHFIKFVSYVAVFLGVTFLILGFVIGVEPVKNLVFAIGIIVANVPEGLLATVTVSLTLTAQRMAEKQVLVKNLESVETLGSTTVIASDKTGTLTQNRMQVSQLFFDNKAWSVPGVKNKDVLVSHFEPANTSFKMLALTATLNSSCALTMPEKKTDADKPITSVKDLKVNGNASEGAFIKFTEVVYRQGLPQPDMKTYAYSVIQEQNAKIEAIPFNSQWKYQAHVHKIADPSGNEYLTDEKGQGINGLEKDDHVVFLKGASEQVLSRCDNVLLEGKEVPIDANYRQLHNDALDKMMFRGERVLGFAYKTLRGSLKQSGAAGSYGDGNGQKINFPIGEDRNGKNAIKAQAAMEQDPDDQKFCDAAFEKLTYIGLISLIDPPRLAVPGAIALCQEARIKVVMVTGDHPKTAEAIARDVGIISGHTVRSLAMEMGFSEKDEKFDIVAFGRQQASKIKAIVISGEELSGILAEDEKNKAAGKPLILHAKLDFKEIVFARTSPKQKLDIVNALQTKKTWRDNSKIDVVDIPIKHVVAVTGDGVNDSPALKKADIGIAMGIAGSDVAKDAADMILLDDNFASIVNGIEEGRLIFDNLKKSIAYTLSSNIPEISPFLVFILTAIPLPLPTVLILCIDLGTDMVPAISLAYENKEADIMRKPPRDNLTDRLVTTKMISFSYLQVGIIQAAAGFFTYIVVLNDYGFHPSILPGRSDWFEDGWITCSAPCTDAATCTPEVCMGDPTYFNYDGDYLTLNPCNIDREGVCHDPEEALAHAQAAFFLSIIIVQWADIVACKTRRLSLKQQGMRNGVLNFGLFFETALGAALMYITPLNTPLGTRPVNFVHWLTGVPFAIFILAYDEIRKFLIRNLGEKNWVERNTFY